MVPNQYLTRYSKTIAPREIIFDETTLNEVKKAIDRAFEFWKIKTGFGAVMDSRQLNEVL